ncbi:PAS domain S-box protein [uncultured Xylophilus sp.]|uniref:PAS domain S-box protein n=1 Tax=uncultured Xylophilus sp. TaxID=296832 RepID=UPI0025E53766|nr:PAS domain S-box protein [uncultured Xylophilus sp.]
MPSAPLPSDLPFLRGGGQMAALIAEYDWSTTALGPIRDWPGHVRTATAMMLRSEVPVVMLWYAPGVMVYNDAYAVFAGARHPQLLGSNVREGWVEVADFNDNVMRVGLAGGTLRYQDQELVLYREGRADRAWMNLDYSPLLDETGEPVGVMALVVETTAKVQAEQALRDERERLAQLFEQAPTVMAMLRGPEHVFELLNPGYQRLVGHRPVVGRRLADALPDAVAQGYLGLLDQVYTSGVPYAATSARYAVQPEPDGPVIERYLDFVYQPIRDGTGAVTGIFVEGVDVTDRTASELALRRSENRLRELNADLERQVADRAHERSLFWQLTPDLLGVLNSSGVFEKVNPAWERLLGWTDTEVCEQPLFCLLHPDDLEDTQAQFDKLVAGSPVVNFVNRYRRRDGAYRWLSWTAVPEQGRYYCTGRDISAAKEAQTALDEAHEALRQSQKMEAVGQLTGGIAHDFNNLLGGIGAALQVLQARLDKGRTDGLGRYIAMGQDAVRRATSLTQRLLAFSRRQTLDPRPVDVNRLVGGMEDLIRRTVGPNVTVEVIGAGGLWPARLDASQLENALLNLCINARDAMQPHGGRLTIETANRWLDDRAAPDRELVPGQYLSLCVTDTGCGMTPETVQRAFDPFFTTKPLGQGTGLGLSMVYGFVRQSGGQVHIYSEVGQGTTMCLYFPRYFGSAEEEVYDGADPAPEQGDGETVLIVEDEATIRMLVTEILEEAGYRVIGAEDGAAGLRVLQTDRRIDLLVTDVGLPGGMNGRQVADAARVTRPELKVLFITGYAENAAVGNGHLERGMAVLTKPFEVVALANKVREMIERP